MLVAIYQQNIVTGNATMYLIRRVKLSSSAKFPMKPNTREMMLRSTHLGAKSAIRNETLSSLVLMKGQDHRHWFLTVKNEAPMARCNAPLRLQLHIASWKRRWTCVIEKYDRLFLSLCTAPKTLILMGQRTHHFGSAKPTPMASAPICPTGYLSLHGETNAAIEVTFAIGPIVAARRGIAVDANHQSL